MTEADRLHAFFHPEPFRALIDAQPNVQAGIVDGDKVWQQLIDEEGLAS